jgi:hypothetical protein
MSMTFKVVEALLWTGASIMFTIANVTSLIRLVKGG